MNAPATAALEQLKRSEFFTHVGLHDTGPARIVSSWKEAIDCCNSAEWEKQWLAAANEIREKVQAVSVARYQLWNNITAEVKEIVIPHVATKCAAVAHVNGLTDLFFHTVRWDVLHYFVELAYSDIAAPGFYHKLWEIYMKGHFPCGWEGAYPEGRPIIY